MELPDKSGAPKKNVQPLIASSEEVKRPATRRFKDAIFQESPKKLVSKVGHDVVVPRLKQGIEEALNSFLSGMLWGNSGVRPISGLSRTTIRGGGIAYSAQSTQSALQQARAAIASTNDNSGNYRDLVVPTIQDAETLLAGMYDLLNEYRVVAVADLYEMANRTPGISDNGIGWRSLDGARISAVRDGFVLELPRPTVI